MALVLAFTTIAPPLSKELGQLVRVTHAKLKGGLLAVGESVIPAERAGDDRQRDAGRGR